VVTLPNAIQVSEMIEGNDSGELAWYCLRTQVKREHVAVAGLAGAEGIEVFCPRVRYQKMTRRGKVWFVEAMFPNYLFARFDWNRDFRMVQSAMGVAGLVHFGDEYPSLESGIIEELRSQLSDSDLKVFNDVLMPGDEVVVAEGPFMGIQAVVTHLLPSRMRVKLLLEFLGQPAVTEIEADKVYKESFSRKIG
jgi:transcriptional antiterminator RfaH